MVRNWKLVQAGFHIREWVHNTLFQFNAFRISGVPGSLSVAFLVVVFLSVQVIVYNRCPPWQTAAIELHSSQEADPHRTDFVVHCWTSSKGKYVGLQEIGLLERVKAYLTIIYKYTLWVGGGQSRSQTAV